MRNDAIWNENGYWESPPLQKSSEKNIKIDITKCVIVFNEFGFIDLTLEGKKLKRLKFNEYLLYKNYVKEIIRNDERLEVTYV